MPKTELTKIKSAEMEIPEWLKGEVGQQHGLENVDQSDLLLPRLGLCQALSPQRRKSDSSYIEGLNEGELFNTVTKEIYGEEIEIVALFFFKNRIKFNPIEEGGGIDCISINGVDGGRICPDGCSACKFSVWGNGETEGDATNDSPLCTVYHNFMAFAMKDNSPVAMSFKSTGLKVSKQFLASVRLTNMPMYARKYKITVKEMSSGQNHWFEKQINFIGFPTAEEYKNFEHQYKQLKAMNVQVDMSGEAGDTSFETEKTEL